MVTALLALAGVFVAATLRTTLQFLASFASWEPPRFGAEAAVADSEAPAFTMGRWTGSWHARAAHWLLERKPVNCDLCLSWWCCLLAASSCIAVDVLPLGRALLLEVPAATGGAFLLFTFARGALSPPTGPSVL